MATIAELQVRIGADIKRLEKGIDKATRKLEDAGRSMRRVGTKMTAAITVPMAALGGAALKTAADFESLEQSMNILNGSVEEGARNFERLKRFSAETPFQLADLAEAQNMLQGFGLSADEAFESMSMIGDIAAVASGDIKGIGIAFGQAAAEGRLMTRDIRQLINQGVPAIKLLSETMGVAKSEVLDLASEGQISFEILQQAFRDATTEGGMFANGMEKQANTLAGVWSTFRDRVSLALGELGEVIVETFDLKQLVKDIGANLQQITERFSEMSKDSQKQILQVAGLFMAGGPILIALGQAAIAISAFAKLVRTRFALITGAAALVSGTIVQQGQLWSKVFGDSEEEVDNFTTSARKGMMKLIGPVLEFTEETLGAGEALDSFMGLLDGLGGQVGQRANKALSDTQKMLSFINGDLNALNSNLEGTSPDTGGSGGGGSDTGQEIDRMGFVESWRLPEGMQQLDRFTSKITEVKDATASAFEDMKASGAAFATASEAAVTESLSKWDQFKVKFKQIGGDFQQFLAKEISGAVLDFGKALGTSLSGAEQTWQTTFEKITMIVLDFASSLARLAAGIGAVMLFIPGMQGAGAGLLAAATALQAVASGVQAGIKKRANNRQERAQEAPALAQGGLAFGPTMAVVGDNRNARSDPEVIAPLSKLQGIMANSGGGTTKVEGIIRGSDIHLANERGKNKFR